MTDEVEKTNLYIGFRDLYAVVLKMEIDIQNISNEIKQIDKQLTRIERNELKNKNN